VNQDRSYSREQDNYKAWVDRMRMHDKLTFGPKYITRENIDKYFVNVVVHKLVKPTTVERTVYALQKMADYQEYADSINGFDIRADNAEGGNLVKVSLKMQEDRYNAYILRKHSIEDPHADLKTNMLSKVDKSRFIDHVLRENKINWQPVTQSFLGCEAMMCRQHSYQKFRLPDLIYNDTHGPNEEGAYDTEMLGIGYVPGVHKEKN